MLGMRCSRELAYHSDSKSDVCEFESHLQHHKPRMCKTQRGLSFVIKRHAPIIYYQKGTFNMHTCICGNPDCRTMDSITSDDKNFRRTVNNIVREKFEGDVYAYIKSLMDVISDLEATLESATIDFLSEAA